MCLSAIQQKIISSYLTGLWFFSLTISLFFDCALFFVVINRYTTEQEKAKSRAHDEKLKALEYHQY